MYTGTMIRELIETVERVTGSPIRRSGDDYMDLCVVKTALADRRPMSGFDEAKWWKADRLQQEVLRGVVCISVSESFRGSR